MSNSLVLIVCLVISAIVGMWLISTVVGAVVALWVDSQERRARNNSAARQVPSPEQAAEEHTMRSIAAAGVALPPPPRRPEDTPIAIHCALAAYALAEGLTALRQDDLRGSMQALMNCHQALLQGWSPSTAPLTAAQFEPTFKRMCAGGDHLIAASVASSAAECRDELTAAGREFNTVYHSLSALIR